ncbi:MAG: hypothetical protein WC708_00250 [Lentisphaeria bacterium]|jgi:hypothetical protein
MAFDIDVHELICNFYRKNRRWLFDEYVAKETNVPISIVRAIAGARKFIISRLRDDGKIERRFIGTTAQYDKYRARIYKNTVKRRQYSTQVDHFSGNPPQSGQ